MLFGICLILYNFMEDIFDNYAVSIESDVLSNDDV